ncbi:hypothetical protein DFH09DRAFT_1167104 [Mycena vulgaris]|nr:hypothetical protein DFH09DRAFT_1167104 [Mycena vulgaris]
MYFTQFPLPAVAALATASLAADHVPASAATRTFPVPAAAISSAGCNPLDCRAECGSGCGGECVKNAQSGAVQCLCDC